MHRYKGDINAHDKIFIVEISFSSDDFIELPVVRVLSWPEGITKVLPHILKNGELCYLDYERIYLDRYDPAYSFYTILENVKRLLISFVVPNTVSFNDDFTDEFVAYWGADSPIFLRSNSSKATLSTFQRFSISAGKDTSESVIHSSSDQINKWIDARKGIKDKIIQHNVSVITIKVKSQPRIPLDGIWPPKSSQDVFNWLLEIDQGAAQSLMDRVGSALKSNRYIFVTLLTSSGSVGFLVKYSPLLQKKFKRSTMRGQNGVSVKTTLFSKLAEDQTFLRCRIVDSTDKRISSRNQPDGLSLLGKKVAIIGCGTVGGFVAKLIHQAGAGLAGGSENGCLAIYDNGYLEPDNLGRHFLDAEYVGENKAKSVAHFLNSRAYSDDVNVKGYNEKISPKSLNGLNKYDLVIDVTGNEQFSTSLNHYIHKDSKEMTVLYAWIDLGGLAVRSLLDDSTGACYRCLRKGVSQKLEERFPLLPSGQQPPEPISRECSSTYFAYASASSMACASLVQQLAVDYFSKSPSPRFRHLSLTNNVLHTKHGNPTKLKGCLGCNHT